MQLHNVHQSVIIRTALKANQVFRAFIVRLYNSGMDEMEEKLRERLRHVYSDTTVDHILRPRNTESLQDPDGFGACRSSCGERMKIWLRIRNDIVADAGFWTDGCAATIACGSMSTDLIKGKSVTEAFGVTADRIADALVDLPEGNLHCAQLAAQALRIALKDHLSLRREPWKKLYRTE
jgi:nitrogen fixation NifU-like protein